MAATGEHGDSDAVDAVTLLQVDRGAIHVATPLGCTGDSRTREPQRG
jgi:hypothetical protein